MWIEAEKKNTDNKKTIRRKKSTKEKNTIYKLLPKRALTDLDISRFATNVLKLSNFRGVFMLDTLPIDSGPLYRENAIVNFNRSTEPGSHWVAYKKKGRYVSYFDSYGDLPPPPELVTYLRGRNSVDKIEYNVERYQKGGYNCGHLCLKFLSNTLPRHINRLSL